jgi:Pretoxin HINT domain
MINRLNQKSISNLKNLYSNMNRIIINKTLDIMQGLQSLKQRIGLSFIVVMMTILSVSAQQKGVDGSLQILTPYPIYLKDFASPINDKVKLTIKSNEFWTFTGSNFKLRMVLEKGNSIIAQGDVPASLSGVSNFSLVPNVPYTLTSAEIAPYFFANNLSGVTNYADQLTEGVYRLSFYVYGQKAVGGTWTLLSDAISQQFWIVQNEPPLLNIPQNGDNIQTTLAEAINFQWIPRAIQVAARQEYEFTLVEIPEDAAASPYATFIVKSSVPLVRRITTAPVIALSASEMPLSVGKVYAWRVKARSLDLFNTEIANFKNNGYSDIFTFRYSGNCDKPTGLALYAQSSDLIRATWTPNLSYFSYRIAYRKYSPAQPFKWVEQASYTTNTNLTQLEFNTEYEVKVGGLCAENFLTYCDPVRVKTLAKDEIKNIVCGDSTIPNLSNETLLASLIAGDSIKAGDFTVNLTRVIGGNGNFTGDGYVQVPWMGDTKFKVKFEGISVNIEKKLIKGFIETAFDPNFSNVFSVDRAFNSNFILDFNVDVVIGSISIDNSTTNGTQSGNGTTGVGGLNGGNSSSGQILIKDENGKVIKILPLGSNYTITDKNGNQYTVSKDGKITKLPPKAGEPIKSNNSGNVGVNKDQPIPSDVPVIVFEKHQNNKYGFDTKTSNSGGGYEELPCTTCGSTNYHVAWKSVATGDSDIVRAKLLVNPTNTPIDSIRFRSEDGGAIYAVYEGSNTWKLHILGTVNTKASSVYALVNVMRNGKLKEEICGKINAIAYDVIKHKVVLIPVNGWGANITESALKTELNSIFKQAIVEYNVTKAANWSTSAYTGVPMKLDHGVLWSYSSDQKDLIKAYQQQFGISDGQTLYLFMLDKAADSQNRIVQGHTPLSKNYGFLFMGNGNVSNRIIAHEVSHAYPCGLEHIFEGGSVVVGSTNNLLDYGTGSEINYQQWKYIRSTLLKIKIGQDEEDGQSAVVQDISQLKKFINSDNKSYTFITPSGQPITLPSDVKSVVFSMGDNWQVSQKDINLFIPFGTLISFETKDKSAYVALGGNNFLGYVSVLDKTKFYEETETLPLNPKQGVIGIPCLRNGFIDFAVGKVNIGAITLVPATNRGTGVQKAWDFLVTKIETLIQSTDNIEFIHVNFNPDLKDIPEVNKFLVENQEFAKFGNINSLYVFAHANQIARYRQIVANDVCGIYYERAYPRNQFLNYKISADNTKLSISYEADREKWLKESVIDWVNMGISRYGQINNTLNTLNRLETETNIDTIISILYNAKGNNCVWTAIPFVGRLNAISLILSSTYVDGGFWSGIIGSNKEYYIVKLLQTTPEQDKVKMLDALLEKNYLLLTKLWDKVNLGNGDQSINILTKWLIEDKKPKQALCGDVLDNRNPRPTDCFYMYKIRDGLSDSKFQFALSGNFSNGLITFETTSTVLQSDGTKKTTTLTNTGKPYDFITLEFDEEFDYSSPIGNGKINKGDKLTVPLIWAYWLQRRYNRDKNVSELMALVQIPLALTTNGFGSVALRQILITTSIGTATIQFNRDYIIREFGDNGQKFVDFADQVALVQGFGELTALGLVKMSNATLDISFDRIRNSVKDFANNPNKLKNIQNGLNLLSTKISGLIKGSSDDALKLANIATDLKNSIFEIGVRSTFKNLSSDFILKIQNATYALLVSGNLEIKMFTGSYIDNLLQISDANWAVGRGTGSLIGYLENVKYCRNGKCEIGTVKVLLSSDNKIVLRRIACFPAGTLVKAKATPKQIQNIEVGDIVKSYDENSKNPTFQKVVNTFRKTTDKLVQVIIGKDTILATPEHPFYIMDNITDGSNNGNWVSAERLKSDLTVQLSSGLFAKVQSVNVFDTTTTVYNFEVENTHNYYVGTEGVLVHNDCAAFTKTCEALTLEEVLNDIEAIEKELFRTRFFDDFEQNVDALKLFNNEKLVDEWLLYRTKEVSQLQNIARWRTGKTFEYGTLTGVAAEVKIFDDLKFAIGNKIVVETFIDYRGRILFVTDKALHDAFVIESTGVANLYRIAKIKYEEEVSICEICPKIKLKVVCDDMTKVLLKANQNPDPLHVLGMSAICASNLNQLEIGVLMVELLKNSWSAVAVGDLLKDLTVVDVNSPSVYISANISTLTVNTLSAWKLVYNAKTTDFKENYRRDNTLLNQVKDMLSTTNATMLTTLGGQTGLTIILQKHYTAPCYTCENNAGNSHLRYMDGYLNDIQYFVATYVSTTNTNQATSVLGGKGIKNSSLWQVRGTAFMLDAIHKPVSITNFTKFEDNLAVASPYTKGCNPDAREDKKIIEFKSWSPEDVVTEEEEESVSKKSPTKNMFKTLATFDYKPNTYNSYTQFRCYISNIDKMEDLIYYFDARKGKVNEGYVRDVFKRLLYVETLNTNNEIVGSLTAQGAEIFDIIWGKSVLRGNIWNDIPAIINQTVIDNYKNKFRLILADTRSSFYKFINVK